jgi:hypothetical protein
MEVFLCIAWAQSADEVGRRGDEKYEERDHQPDAQRPEQDHG